MAKSSKKTTNNAPSVPNTLVITGISNAEISQKVNQQIEGLGNKKGNTTILCFGSAATSYSELQNTVNSLENDAIGVMHADQIDLLSQIIWGLKKNQASVGEIIIPDFETKKVKRTILAKIGNIFTKTLGYIEVNGADSGVCYLNKQDAESKELFTNNDSTLNKSNYRFANYAILKGGLKQKSGEIANVTPKQINFSFFKAFLSSFIQRIQWFTTIPLKEFSLSNLRNGNHSTYRLFFGIICFVSFVLLPILSFDYGTTWDEPEDRKYFTEVISYFQTGGEDTRALDESRKLHDHLVNYGPLVNLTCAFAEEYISPFDTYETRHIVLSLFALVGLIFTGLLARKAGTWRTAVIVMLILLLTPAFWGHATNNQKDMPFMAFYIASLFYIVRFIQELPKVRLKTLIMTGITMGILFSIRAGGLIVFAYLGLFAVVKFGLTLIDKKKDSKGHFMKYLMNGMIAVAIAYFIGVIFWPAALQDPFNHPLEALKNFEKFSLVHVYEIFEGQRYYMKDYPWYYGPKMMAITLPLFILSGVALFLAGLKWLRKKYDSSLLIILAFTIVFPIAYIIYKESALYNSWRHILFVLPSTAILAAIGWDYILQLKQKVVRIGTAVVLAGLMGMTGIWMVKNHPYEYMYYNEIVGGVKGAFGKYELDYWCQTPKEAIQWIHENVDLKDDGLTKVISNNEIFSLQYYSDRFQENGDELRQSLKKIEEITAQIDKLNHYKKEGLITEAEHKTEVDILLSEKAPEQKMVDSLRKVYIMWSRELNWNKDDWDYAIWTNRTLSPTLLEKGYFPPKGTIHTIDVDGVPVAAIVKRENKNIYEANELIKKQQYAQAEKLLKDYIAYDPLEEEAYRTLGYLCLIERKYDECIEWCNKSLELCPENYFSHHFAGVAYIQPTQYSEVKDAMARIDSADKHFKLSAKYKPNFSSAYDGQGDVALARGDKQTALKMYKEALQYSGSNPQTYYKAGQVYFDLNDINNAATYFNAAIQTNKNYAPPYYGMYQVYLKAGNNEEANKYLQQFQQLRGM